MLFNSYAFLFVFLPVSLLIQGAIERYAANCRRHSLVALSLAFYGYWDWRFIVLLVGSILVNWALIARIAAGRSRLLLGAAIAGNLSVLGLFKYLGFAMQASNLLGLFSVTPMSLALPLGISFFTFHHVMYLTDLRAGRAPRLGLVDYALYIAFFPQVLAGPLVRWRELIPQLAAPCFRPGFEEPFGRGLILLTIGLCKKVLVGDPLAAVARPAFEAAQAGTLPIGQAWDGLLAFTIQIYFDFSGYTDMALGTALLFGIVLPQNFAVPYRAASIAEFWRRWHMTLSRFLRDYLYIPLGGNRHGMAVQVAALLVTMALGGLWHGAGATFLIWGLFQGVGLVAHLLWARAGASMAPWLGAPVTFLFVALGWVLFRAQDLGAALHYYRALFGMAPGGGFNHALGLIAGGALAVLGPTSWDIAHTAAPSRKSAAILAVAMVAVLLQMNDSASYEFIYFRF